MIPLATSTGCVGISLAALQGVLRSFGEDWLSTWKRDPLRVAI